MSDDFDSWEYEPDTLESGLIAGAGCDWITPIFSTFGSLFGRTKQFTVPLGSIHVINATLGDAGIEVLRHQFESGTLLFEVRKSDADKAEQLLGFK